MQEGGHPSTVGLSAPRLQEKHESLPNSIGWARFSEPWAAPEVSEENVEKV
jgi:hypothetical protein